MTETKKYKVVMEATVAMTFEVEAESLAEAAEYARGGCLEGHEPDSEEIVTDPNITKIHYGNESSDFIDIDHYHPEVQIYQGGTPSLLVDSKNLDDALNQVERLLASEVKAETVP